MQGTLPKGNLARNSAVSFVTPMTKSDGTSILTPAYWAAIRDLLARGLPEISEEN
jgi:hypothetical protein